MTQSTPNISKLFFWACLTLLVRADQGVLTEEWLMSQNSSSSLERIAIIGGGITGASAALALHQSISSSEVVQIDLFEASSRVGGQIESITNPDNEGQTIELGAATFSEADICLHQSIAEVGLRSFEVYPYAWKTLGIWDGVELRRASSEFQCNLLKLSWMAQAHLIWRYGWSVQRLRAVIEDTLTAWVRPLNVSAVHNTSELLNRMGYHGGILGPARQYLEHLGVSSGVVKDYAEVCVRKTTWNNINESRALVSLMSMNINRPSRVEGGNRRLIERLISQSGAKIRTNLTVKAIKPGFQRRYSLDIVGEDNVKFQSEYDTVIIATPLQSSGIDLESRSTVPVLHEISQSHSSDLWVTIVVTPAELAPTFFGLPDNISMSDDIVTTRYSPRSNYSGPEILSITRSVHRWRDSWCEVDPDCDQFTEANRYRLVSRTEIDRMTLRAMLGLGPESSLLMSTVDDDWVEDIHWARSKMWAGVVKPYVESTDGQGSGLGHDFKLMEGLYDAGGGAELMSSLEMGCRMGKNIAALVLKDRESETSSFQD